MKHNALQRLQKGFTVIEFLLVMTLFSILISFVTMNLVNVQHTNYLTTSLDLLMADLKEQQLKAMVGDAEGTGVPANYGIRFNTTTYTFFRNTYGTANFVNTLPTVIQVTTTFPSNEVTFLKGSGEISGFASSSATITLRDIGSAGQKVVTLNKYGVITGVN